MSRFVSGGTVEQPAERDDAWLKAQQDIDERHRQKQEQAQQGEGKSLFDTLQANKAAKQEAFEESIRLKNQFRSLDEDEVDFLDSLLESTRAKEAAVKKETAEQLDLFRRQREEREKQERAEEAPAETADGGAWAVSGRKRKRAKDKDALPGVKARKSSSAADTPASLATSKPDVKSKAVVAQDAATKKSLPTPTASSGPIPRQAAVKEPEARKSPIVSPSPPAAVLGLGGYSSDED